GEYYALPDGPCFGGPSSKGESKRGERSLFKHFLLIGPGVARLGSARYMSPEQARGEVLCSATDVFSLGIVLFELVTGRHPCAAESQVGVLHAIMNPSPVPASRLNPEVTAPLTALLEGMLSKDPALRK